jgi:nucleotidyltransferase/DNA polymerase involved in DNA repair
MTVHACVAAPLQEPEQGSVPRTPEHAPTELPLNVVSPASNQQAQPDGLAAAAADAAAWWARPASAWTPDEQLLAAGAVVVAQLRSQVHSQLGFTLSAGIAHTKVVAKLASGLHKPSQQTLVPARAVDTLLAPLPVARLRSLGGKFGETVTEALGIVTVGAWVVLVCADHAHSYGCALLTVPLTACHAD